MYSKIVLAAAVAALTALGSTSAMACNKGKQTCTFKLFNNTSYDVISFQASPVRAKNWENDILGKSILKSGQEANVNLSDKRSDCIYDFRVKFSDGDTVEKRGVNVCTLNRYTLND